jgi:ATP-dependent Clp protease adaptor protein ClpS
MNMSGTSIETVEEIDLVELLADTRKLVVYNDDVNTFDHVIESLITICKHDEIQAEQLATLIHYKGRAIVKEGDTEKIAPMCTALTDRGISAVIE